MVWTRGENGRAPYGYKIVDDGSNWSAGARATEVNLNEWCEGGLEKKGNDNGIFSTMRERYEGMQRPVAFVDD